MTIENVIIIFLGLAFIASLWLGASLLEKVFSLQVEVKGRKSEIKGLIENIDRLEEENKALKRLSNRQASETVKKVDWEPDDYNALTDGSRVDISRKFNEHNYKRLNSDDLDEVSHMLTDDELRKYGG